MNYLLSCSAIYYTMPSYRHSAFHIQIWKLFTEVSKHHNCLLPMKELRHKLKRPDFQKNEHFQPLLILLGKKRVPRLKTRPFMIFAEVTD